MSKVIIDGVEYVPKVEAVKEWPREGDEYWCVVDTSANITVFNCTFNEYSEVDNARKKAGNMFPTPQKAEYERLRRECMATRWVPEDGEIWNAMGPGGAAVVGLTYSKDSLAVTEAIILGLARPTAEEAKARWDMYGDAWLDALNAGDVTTKK